MFHQICDGTECLGPDCEESCEKNSIVVCSTVPQVKHPAKYEDMRIIDISPDSGNHREEAVLRGGVDHDQDMFHLSGRKLGL